MAGRDLTTLELRRLQLLLLVMLVLILTLGGFIFNLQVVRGHEFEESLHRQSLRRVRLAAPRGRILDRQGVRLADNQPCYCLAFYIEELRRPGRWKHTVEEIMHRLQTLALVVGRKPLITEDDVWLHIRRRLPLPLVAWRNLDPAALARLSESALDTQGVDIYIEPVRSYPARSLAAQVLGFVGKAELGEDDIAGFQYYLPEMEGKAGLERRFNEALAGEAGGRLLRIDASGYKHAERVDKEPRRGLDLVLALDVRVQQLAEAALRDVAGAAVVLDPSTGDVLAMASAPSFDPNTFVPFLPAALWAEKSGDPAKPLSNRAATELYAPGSIFKPLVALAALETQAVTPGFAVDCPGHFTLGRYTLRCWNPNGHGTVDLRRGIEQSCNAYFAAIGLRCGPGPIATLATACGLGQKTGIALEREAAGLVPTPEWKRKAWKDDWRTGDTCNFSIGQGALTVTPLQMAVVAAALANGGAVYRPRMALGLRDAAGAMVTNFAPVLVRRLPVSEGALREVRLGMRDVVMAPTGTGGKARVAGVEMAGKTGTAEFIARGERRKHGWMLVFAPFDQPRYAVAMVVDEADSGGRTVGPRLHGLMAGLFGETAAGGEPGGDTPAVETTEGEG
jgi:penicillin-binding protein 2